jgi:hypothetical protein
MRIRRWRVARVWLLLGGVGKLLAADQLPQIEVETLSGAKIELPSAVKGKPAVLCIGFSRSSKTLVKPWTTAARAEFKNSPVVVLSIAVLQGAPKFVRGMIIHGMKGDVPPEEYSKFLVLYQNESELKQAVGFEAPDDAYVVLLDEAGAIRDRMHGEVTTTAIRELSSRIAALSASTKP